MNDIYRIRKNKIVMTGLAAVLFCLISAVRVGAEEINLTEADDCRKVEINTGDVLTIRLAGNPTTGYTWEKVYCDGKVLLQEGDVRYTPSALLAGSGGVFVFAFRAVAAGETTLRIIYYRPFEIKVAPVKFLEISVKVK